jgi:hypothetical protein
MAPVSNGFEQSLLHNNSITLMRVFILHRSDELFTPAFE